MFIPFSMATFISRCPSAAFDMEGRIADDAASRQRGRAMFMADDGRSVSRQSGSPLGRARPGFRGRVEAIQVADGMHGPPVAELESRLIELGFIEGASVEVLHEGPFGDPIAVRVNGATIALRRREAMAIIATPTDGVS